MKKSYKRLIVLINGKYQRRTVHLISPEYYMGMCASHPATITITYTKRGERIYHNIDTGKLYKIVR